MEMWKNYGVSGRKKIKMSVEEFRVKKMEKLGL